MNRFAAMRTFVEIVDRGSLTAAAVALGRSQPAIVRTLAALETHLGARLLQRTTRRMSLTPEGRDFLDGSRVDDSDAVLSSADENVSSVAGPGESKDVAVSELQTGALVAGLAIQEHQPAALVPPRERGQGL